MKPFLFLLALVFMPLAHAREGSEGGNGGDPVALQFQRAALEAILDVQENIDQYPELKSVNLRGTLRSAQIFVVDEPLPLRKLDLTQAPAVINYKNPNRFVIYRKGWQALANQEDGVRRALALHELLGLAGLEETGVYHICERYLGKTVETNFTYNREQARAARIERDIQLHQQRILRVIAKRYIESCLFCGPSIEERLQHLDPKGTGYSRLFRSTDDMLTWLSDVYRKNKWEGADILRGRAAINAAAAYEGCVDDENHVKISPLCLARGMALLLNP